MILNVLALLSKFTGISKLLLFFKTKKRLFVEYVLLAVLIAVGAGLYSLWNQRQKTIQSVQLIQTRLTLVEAASQAQQKVIKRVQAQRLIDAGVIEELMVDLEGINAGDVDIRSKVKLLENSNATVKDFINAPIPGLLRELLNDDPGESGGGEQD